MCTVKSVMADAVIRARRSGHIHYVYEFPSHFLVLDHPHPDITIHWIFRAYPGGRKELSKRGSEIVRELELAESVTKAASQADEFVRWLERTTGESPATPAASQPA